MYCLATWAEQWWEFLAKETDLSESDPYSVFTDYTVLFCSTTLLLYNKNTSTWWLCMDLSLLGGIKIGKLSRLCEFNFHTLQSAYIYNSNVWKASEVIKITTIKSQRNYSSWNTIPLFILGNKCEPFFFFLGRCEACEPRFFPP